MNETNTMKEKYMEKRKYNEKLLTAIHQFNFFIKMEDVF